MGFSVYPVATTPLSASDVLLIEQGGTTKRIDADAINARKLGFRVERSGSDFALANATFTDIEWDSEAWDHGAFSNLGSSTTDFTVPSGGGGIYQVTLNAQFAATVSTLQLRVQVNGANVAFTRAAESNTGTTIHNATAAVELSAGDTIVAQAWQNSGGSLSILASTINFLSVVRVAGE